MFYRLFVWVLCLGATLGIVPVLAQPSPVAGFPPGAFQSRAAIDATAAGGASVAFDAATTPTSLSGGASPWTWTHTPVGTPTAALVQFVNFVGGATITGITYGGNSMTAVAGSPVAIDGSNSVYQYCLPNPPAGAQTVNVNFTGLAFVAGGSITVTGSNTVTCATASNTATGTGTTASLSVTSNANELVVDFVATDNANTTTQTAGGGQTARISNTVSGNNVGSGSTKAASASNTSMSWTISTSTAWAQIATSVKP